MILRPLRWRGRNHRSVMWEDGANCVLVFGGVLVLVNLSCPIVSPDPSGLDQA